MLDNAIWQLGLDKKKKILMCKLDYRVSLISAWWSSFSVALSAVNWPATVWLEWNITFLSAVSTGCLVHLFWIHSHFHFLFMLFAQRLVLHASSILPLPFKFIHTKRNALSYNREKTEKMMTQETEKEKSYFLWRLILSCFWDFMRQSLFLCVCTVNRSRRRSDTTSPR